MLWKCDKCGAEFELDEFPEELTDEDLIKLNSYIDKIMNNAHKLRYRPNPWQGCDI